MYRVSRRVAPLAAAALVASAALTGCGGSSGGGSSNNSAMTLTILYRNVSQGSTKTAQVLEQELSAAGVKVKLLGTSNADFYTKYLQSKTAAKDGTWDVAIAGWGPDWYGDAAASFFLPLFSGEQSYPWNGGSNFGLYNSDATNALIAKAQAAKTPAEAQAIWAQADKQVMTDAAIFPITDPQEANYHSKNISNAVPIPSLQQIDPAIEEAAQDLGAGPWTRFRPLPGRPRRRPAGVRFRRWCSAPGTPRPGTPPRRW